MNGTSDESSINSTDALGTRLTRDWKLHEYISIVIVSLFVPIILCSNFFVVASVIKFRRLQIPTNYFVLSLATADIVIALALPFYVLLEVAPIRVANSALCLTANRTLMTAGAVSILTLSVIAYDRYTAVMRPLEYIMFMTTRKICCFVFFTWVYSIIMSWLPVICGWHGDISDSMMLCSNSLLYSRTRIIYIGAIFMPACCCILYCYCRIFLIARHHAHAIAAMENSVRNSIERQFVKIDTKYAKTIAVVIGVFLSLWLPYQSYLFLEFINSVRVNYWVKNYLMLIAFSNSAINPWLYAYKNKDFRSAYKRISKNWCCKDWFPTEDRRTSALSQISVISPSSVTGRLNRSNSRVLASDILYSLSQQLGKDNVDQALNSHIAANHGATNHRSLLPELIRMYSETYHGDSNSVPMNRLTIPEEPVPGEGTQKPENRDSAFSNTEFVSESSL